MLLFHVRSVHVLKLWRRQVPVSLSTELTQTATSLYKMLNFNSIGITGMAQFPSYIRNKLYQHNPESIFYSGSVFYNTYIIWTSIEYGPGVHFLWGVHVLRYRKWTAIDSGLGVHFLWGSKLYSTIYRIWALIEYGPGSNFYGCPYSHGKWTPIDNGPGSIFYGGHIFVSGVLSRWFFQCFFSQVWLCPGFRKWNQVKMM